MRDIRDTLDLAELQHAGKGFIWSARFDRFMLHKAPCSQVGAYGFTSYPMKFFETYAEAARWLNEKYTSDWRTCGHCYPTNY
jgi:hypothetical protein